MARRSGARRRARRCCGKVRTTRRWALEAALFASRPRVAMAHLTGVFRHQDGTGPGIHPSAVIDPTAEIGQDAAIGPLTVIEARARIGARSRISAHCFIGSDARIGDDAHLQAGTHIGARCTVGDRFVAQPGAIIGADGFSFEPPDHGVDQAVRKGEPVLKDDGSGWLRIHSLAAVEIGDDVEIGAATTIDRGTLAPTRIGAGTKIDNQVQVGHNVQIGRHCLICAQVGLAGSCRIGDRTVLSGKVGVGDYRRIGSDVVCAASSMVAANIADGSVVMGIPAVDHGQATREFMAIRRLPRLFDQVAEIRKKLGL